MAGMYGVEAAEKQSDVHGGKSNSIASIWNMIKVIDLSSWAGMKQLSYYHYIIQL
jgi:hypothetical protein